MYIIFIFYEDSESAFKFFPHLMNGETSLGRLSNLPHVSQLGWKANLCLSVPPPSKGFSALSCLTVFQFWFWWKCIFVAIWWVCGWKVIRWYLGGSQCPPRASLPAGTLFPRVCSAGRRPWQSSSLEKCIKWHHSFQELHQGNLTRDREEPLVLITWTPSIE